MRVYCGVTHCGEYLGSAGPSGVQMNPKPVWRIEQGWTWKQGILERSDFTLRNERKLIHETFGHIESRVNVAREVNLPVVVRCPKCHGLRLVQPDVVLRPILLR